MKKEPEFLEHVRDVLTAFGHITFRAMFGGYGVYKNGIIFAIIADEMLYLKTHKTNQKDFENIGSEAFTYDKGDGKKATMSYWLVTDDLMEDREELAKFARKSYEIAAAKSKSKKK